MTDQGDQLEAAKLLLEFKADAGITNKYGLTPLDIASTFNRIGFLDLLNDYRPKLLF